MASLEVDLFFKILALPLTAGMSLTSLLHLASVSSSVKWGQL